MINLLKAALWYQNKGYSVIPVDNVKRPYIKWQQHQTKIADEEQIQAWWQKWPAAMIGLVTGPVSGIMVVDVDSQVGYDTLDEFLPESLVTPVSRTPSGGWHFYFQYCPGLVNRARVITDCDVRTDGGYIIAPPSINSKGEYAWLPGLKISDVQPAAMPEMLFDILQSGGAASSYNSSLSSIKGCGQNKPQETTKTTTNHNFFAKGRRDEDLFHAANCLIKGGCEPAFTQHVVEILAKNSTPPFPEKEIKAKIQSALNRAATKERNIAGEVREWVETTSGHFQTTDCHKELQLTTKDNMKAANMALLRFCEPPNPTLEKYGNKRGCYRRIETDVEAVDFLNAPTQEFHIKWPLEIENKAIIYPSNIIIVAGGKSAGKTGFLLNVVRMNMYRHDIVYLNSEMGDSEFRKRLELFDNIELKDWKLNAYHRSCDFADLITPDEKIFIVDFLEVSTEFWRVAGMIQEIHRKLKKGICIIALQKAEGKDVGRGGDFSKEKSRLYLSLDYLSEIRENRIKIVDAKAWRSDRNPRGMTRQYKLVSGSKFVPTTRWIG